MRDVDSAASVNVHDIDQGISALVADGVTQLKISSSYGLGAVGFDCAQLSASALGSLGNKQADLTDYRTTVSLPFE